MVFIDTSSVNNAVNYYRLSDHCLRRVCLCAAGTDTSRITLSILIGLVAEHPEVQKKMQKELDDVLGEPRASMSAHERTSGCTRRLPHSGIDYFFVFAPMFPNLFGLKCSK